MTRAFFETRPYSDRQPRLLLISYHFPPGQAAGALRWEKLAAFAAERGWGVDVIMLDPADLPMADPTRLERLPRGIRIYGVRDEKHRVEGSEHAAWKV